MERLGGGGDTQQLVDRRDPNQQLGSNSTGFFLMLLVRSSRIVLQISYLGFRLH